jgi:hypothetical protein
MSIGDFEYDTRPEGAQGRYLVTLSKAWDVWGPNGGYVAAIALRAMAAESTLPRPGAFHCQFLKPGKFEKAEILVERLRAGKRSEALRARLVQDGEDLVAASLWMTAEAMEGLEHDHAAFSDAPAPNRLKSFAEIYDNYPSWYAYWRSVEARPVSETAEPSRPSWRAWLRFVMPPGALDPVLAAARTVFWMDLGTRRRVLTRIRVLSWGLISISMSSSTVCRAMESGRSSTLKRRWRAKVSSALRFAHSVKQAISSPRAVRCSFANAIRFTKSS